MKYLPVALALFAAAIGFIAAWIWNKASDAGNADYTAHEIAKATPPWASP